MEPVKRIGPCAIQRRLAKGSSGTVYLAHHDGLGREVALKILDPRLIDSPTAVQRFKREAQAAQRILHPNVAQIVEVGSQDSVHYIVQELVEGESLKDHLEQSDRLSLSEVARLGLGLASALASLHAVGVVHRDLKPDNVVIEPDGEAKLVDFGLCLDLSEAGPRLTRSGSLLGTPLYMSPEQLDQPDKVGPKTDVFGLGVLLYLMLTGQAPHERPGDRDAWGLIRRRVGELPEDVQAVRRDTPPALAALINRLLASDPEQRPTAAEAASTLNELAIGLSSEG